MTQLAQDTRRTTMAKAARMQPNPHWAKLPLFDRKGWKKVRFGDVVDLVNETCREPEAEGITRFIGLEHLEPGSLHIKTWGEIADGTTFNKRCRVGQVLFGKRRAYQRKVALAEFDALISGDIYAFQAKEEFMDPKLLPFLCMSDSFFDHAVETSAGSLSPRTNWRHLAQFEFSLPPLEQQRRMAELLWAVDEAELSLLALAESIESYRTGIIEEFITHFRSKKGPLSTFVTKAQYGSSTRAKRYKEGPAVPILGIPNIIKGEVDYADLGWLEVSEVDEKYILREGDILIVRTNGNPEYVGRNAVFENSKYDTCLFASYLIRIQVNKSRAIPEYVHEMLSSNSISREYKKHVTSSAGNHNINAKNIQKIEIPIPSLKDQSSLIDTLGKVDSSQHSLAQHHNEIRKLLKTVIERFAMND